MSLVCFSWLLPPHHYEWVLPLQEHCLYDNNDIIMLMDSIPTASMICKANQVDTTGRKATLAFYTMQYHCTYATWSSAWSSTLSLAARNINCSHRVDKSTYKPTTSHLQPNGDIPFWFNKFASEAFNIKQESNEHAIHIPYLPCVVWRYIFLYTNIRLLAGKYSTRMRVGAVTST